MPNLLTGIDWLDSLRLHGRNRYEETDRDNVESKSHAALPYQARSFRMDGKFWDTDIPATDILDLEAGAREIDQYKTHLATRSRSGSEPLHTFVRNWSTWV